MAGILQETGNAYPSRAPLLLILFHFSVWYFSFVFVLCLVPNVFSVSGDCPFVIFPSGFSSVYIMHISINTRNINALTANKNLLYAEKDDIPQVSRTIVNYIEYHYIETSILQHTGVC
jgi:hypothetical protein